MIPKDYPSTELSMPKLVGAEGELDSSESHSYPDYSYPEIFSIENSSNNDWRKPMVEYLQNPTSTVSRKTKYKALSDCNHWQ